MIVEYCVCAVSSSTFITLHSSRAQDIKHN
jgi:hypothetical protein